MHRVRTGRPAQMLHDGTPAFWSRRRGSVRQLAADAIDDHVVVTEHIDRPTVDLASAGTSTARSRRSSTSSAAASCCPPGERSRSSSRPIIPVEYDAWDVEAWTRGLGDRIAAACSRSNDHRRRPAGGRRWCVRREFGSLDDDADLHDARRQRSARPHLRHRLARGRAAAVADGAARRARPRGRVRHPVRPRDAADAREQLVGRRQVRGVRPSLRRSQRARRSAWPC